MNSKEYNRKYYAKNRERIIEKRKKSGYLEKYLEKVRIRYRTDKEYRERIKERYRNKYRNDPVYHEYTLKKAKSRYHHDPEYREKTKRRAIESRKKKIHNDGHAPNLS
ncbi:MAG TPA: hypothetical protein P5105_06110 [Victivallales bacterium]|nr:hypothetical protein [Victivallales bacterium]HPO90182.1 hypothetical protein [Victivallales bacterium]HRR06839.1 hypothetical protein [Victivallales bacterium]HRR28601.1 hypothetical protein [Victivallales bacterium]HRU00065.1 hypothetical protein [Victivallales bacterium]